MRSSAIALALMGLCLMLATPAAADEIIYFANGTSMPVVSHRVEKEMIYVNMGGESKMAFPLRMVDRIEAAGKDVYQNPTYHPANQAVAGSKGGSGTGGAVASAPSPSYEVMGASPAQGGAQGSRARNVSGSAFPADEAFRQANMNTLGRTGASRNDFVRQRVRAVMDASPPGQDSGTEQVFTGTGGQAREVLLPTSMQKGAIKTGLIRLMPRATTAPSGDSTGGAQSTDQPPADQPPAQPQDGDSQ